MTKMHYEECLLILLACLMMVGCSGKTVTALSGMNASEVDALFKKAEACLSSGEVDRAVMILDRGLNRCTETEQKERAHRTVLRALTRAGRYEDVEERYLALAERDRRMAMRLLDQVAADLKSRGRYAEVVNICRRLAEKEESDARLAVLFAMEMESLRADGRFYAVLDLIPACVEKLSYEASHEVVKGLLGSIVESGRYGDMDRLVEFIEARFGDREGFNELCIVAGIERLIRTSSFEEAERAMTASFAGLSDVNLAQVVRSILKQAEYSKKTAVVDRVCAFVVERAGAKRRTISAVVVPWTRIAAKAEDWPTVAHRFSVFMDLKACPSTVFRAYSTVCYDVIRADDRESLKELVKAGLKLSGQLVDPVESSILSTLLLDCSFVVEEYDVALAMLANYSSGFSAEEKREVAAMTEKLLAHQALKAGNSKLAVERFRSFMEQVKQWEKDPMDPIAGETVPKEMVLGLNAKRVADILASTGDRKGASDASAEARKYYETALSRLPEDSERYAELEKELKKLR